MQTIKPKGHPLAVFMARYKLNNKKIAVHFDKTPQTIAKWLSGVGSPNMGDFAKFSKEFGLIETNNLCRDWIEHKRNIK